MIQLQNISKSFGSRTLFKNISLQMTPGERLGLAGRNGHGKTTLFKIILGQEESDGGHLIIPKGYRLGHLAQHLVFTEETILAEACLGLPEDEKALTYKGEIILMGLGFSKQDLERAPKEFSGGYQIRINLAKLLLSEPNLLLLDEPTNYLDIVSIRWLAEFLKDWKSELMLITHDRQFMNQVTTHTALIHRGQLRKVQGSTEKLYSQVAQDEEIYEKTRLNAEKKRKQEEAFIERFRAKASKATLVQSRIKQLEKKTQVVRLEKIESLDFEFHYERIEADRLLQIHSLNFHYDGGPTLIDQLSLTVKAKDRIGIIGKNGKGKSTLLKLIAEELKPISGNIKGHLNLKTGYFGQTNIQRLNETLSIEQELQSSNPNMTLTQIRSLAGTLLFSGDQATKKIKILSGGEKSRVLLGKILANPANLLLLDEPTNHLDLDSIEALLDALENFGGAVLIVTHSEMILNRIANKLIVFGQGGAEFFDGTYEDFLERIGWEEEGGDDGTNKSIPVEKKEGSKKDLRQKRSELVSQKSRELAPVRKEIESIEKELPQLEKELSCQNEKLILMSQDPKKPDFAELSKTIKTLQTKIDGHYKRWEVLHAQEGEVIKKYEELLGEFIPIQ